ncbi:MAG TPA: hydroxymethylbilane synthase [Planctomycetaceae bacterium]
MNSSSPRTVRIATRASRLALWQANHVAGLLELAAPDVNVEIVHVTTSGDRDQTGALTSFGGLGVFTREVQKAVLDGEADLAVHSLKDLPTESAAGLCLAAVPEREETTDALVLPAGSPAITDLTMLPSGTRLGTGSLRRQAQLLHLRPDFQFIGVRGNVETRVRKLDAGEFDALVLAVAGLARLKFADRISLKLAPPVMFAAVGQGALGIESREADADLRALLAQLDDANARTRVTAERALLAHLRAGCHAPVGAATRIESADLVLEAVVLSPDGRERIFAEGHGPAASCAQLGQEVADRLLAQGADRLIRDVG